MNDLATTTAAAGAAWAALTWFMRDPAPAAAPTIARPAASAIDRIRDRIASAIESPASRERRLRSLRAGRISGQALPQPQVPDDTDGRRWSSQVWRIEDGRVHEHAIAEPLLLPFDPGSEEFEAAWVRPELVDWQVARVVEVIARCAPWVRVYIGPRPTYVTRMGIRWAGLACRSYPGQNTPAILLSGNANHSGFNSILHHELWHTVEFDLSKAAIEAVDLHLRNGIDWNEDDYLACITERRARAYAAWAEARDEGLPLPEPTGELTWEQVFRAIYTGELAASLGPAYRRRPDEVGTPDARYRRERREAGLDEAWIADLLQLAAAA